jgi:prolyl oligopeptidase
MSIMDDMGHLSEYQPRNRDFCHTKSDRCEEYGYRVEESDSREEEVVDEGLDWIDDLYVLPHTSMLMVDIGTLSNDHHLFFSTTDGIEAGRILSLDGDGWDTQPELSLQVVVPQHKDGLILQSAHLANDQILVLVYLRDACAEIVFADARTGQSIGKTDSKGTRGHATADHIEIPVPHEELDAQRRGQDPVVIPKHASISAVSCRTDSDELYLAIDTYVAPPYVLTGKIMNDPEYGVDVHIGRLDHGNAPHEDLVCREVMYTSHDGVKIPLFINHAKDLDITKPQPVLLHAYGGSGMCLTPHYNPLFASFMRNLRGM